MHKNRNNTGYKYDTHVHTSQGSLCGDVTGGELVDYYKQLGYSGFMITDHFVGSVSFVAKEEPKWNKKVEKFLAGYRDAKKRGDDIDFDVLLGLEFNYKNTEFIFTNLTVEQIIDGEKILQSQDLIEILKWVKDKGGFVIHVHPFRLSERINTIRLIPDYVDAIEVYNSANVIQWPNANVQAEYYAKELNKRETSGTDFHYSGTALMGGVVFPHRVRNESEFTKAIQLGDYELIKTEF